MDHFIPDAIPFVAFQVESRVSHDRFRAFANLLVSLFADMDITYSLTYSVQWYRVSMPCDPPSETS